MEFRSVADIEGPWVEQSIDSGLIQRCKENWHVPISNLSNYALATFIRQKLGLIICIPEAKRRIAIEFTDDTEIYDEELEYAVNECK
ncbi:hypothetical protein QE250_07055 [Chromatiaceae bacterium AAb-1]|nr:hypothetical protein [Chromatiaceae bacterium AAb-1]